MKQESTDFYAEQLIEKAFKFHLQGNISEAEKYYQKFLDKGLSDARVNSNLGQILRDKGNFKKAELLTRQAIKLIPSFADSHCNLGIILRDLGNLKEAELSTRKAIELNPDYVNAHYNLGIILRDLGKLKEAEVSTRKAIKLNPNLANAHSNLGNILRDLGKLKEAEISIRKAIEIKPNFGRAYYSLSLLKYSDKNMRWRDQLFSETILNNKSQKDKVNIYFARANILHKENNYEESSKFLKLANQYKPILHSSNADTLINKSKVLLIESDKEDINKKEHRNFSESIFIVGMPRSGSTLLESILSMNNDVYDLGEINILEESFQEYKKSKEELSLDVLYEEKVNNKTQLNITTNKRLYNYQYAGIIAKQIPSAKIIPCYRNPLDNILSIFRAHFASGHEYSSSLYDCAKVYLDQETIMAEYKNRFRSTIYDLNYDSLVSNPKQEIKCLISWLGWKWDNRYLSPHLNPRSVSTASNVEVRSPINSKSIDGWKNYKEMLKPAIDLITKAEKYQHLLN